jgi:hypothetical protein
MFDSKFHQWMLGLAVGLIALACYWGKKNSSMENLRKADRDFSYEMPRPAAHSPDFDLSGRSILRRTQTIKNVTVNKPGSAPAVAAAVAAKTSDAARKTAEQKKKTDAAKKAEAARRSKTTVNIAQGSSEDTHMARIADASGGGSGSLYAGAPAVTTAAAGVADAAGSSANNDVVKMTASQWQSLLMAQPTAANGAEFLASYKAQAVDTSTFYQISSMLLTDTAKDRETLGLSLLQQTPSLRSFSILVDSASQIQDASLKSSANQVIASYSSPSQFGVLAQALYSTDAHVVTTATDLISTALETEGSQGQGGSGGSPTPPQDFQIFVPGLRVLAASSDPAVASQAQALLNSIQALHA